MVITGQKFIRFVAWLALIAGLLMIALNILCFKEPILSNGAGLCILGSFPGFVSGYVKETDK